MRKPALFCALFIAGISFGGAQTATFELNTAYQCPAETTFRVLSCAGAGPRDSCQVETTVGRNRFPGQQTQADIVTLIALCHRQTPLEAQAAALGAAPGKDINGFTIREQVQVTTSQGMKSALILAMNGNDYRVLLPDGTEALKLYPSEIRRMGPLTERDRALGLFNLHERVQVVMEGKVEVGEITAVKGLDYEVQLAPNRFVWANGRVLLLVPGAPAGAGVKVGAPPLEGLTICGGAIEGRYMPRGEGPGLIIEVRAGNARVRTLSGNEHTLECWMGGGKVYLHRPGQPVSDDLLVEVNSNGSLKTPFGEISKPPIEGLTSCVGVIEGRYMPRGEVPGLIIESRSGNARVRALDGSEHTRECWMGGGKVYLHRVGQPVADDMVLEIINNGSIKTPFGEISRPPIDGLTSCVGVIEGRYEPRGNAAGLTVEFRSGNARIRERDGSEYTRECWMGGGKVYLHPSGKSYADDLVLEIQSNGSLNTPQGEISKK